MATTTKTKKSVAKTVAAAEKPAKIAKPAKAAAAPKGEFAVIATGGKQFVVSVGDLLKIEILQGEHKEGETITFDQVLLVDDGAATTIGTPTVSGAKVTATLEKISRYPKVDVVHYKQKSRYYKKYGHRQPYFEVKITSIK